MMNTEQIDKIVSRLKSQAMRDHVKDGPDDLVKLLDDAADAIYHLSVDLAINQATDDFKRTQSINDAVEWVEMMLRSVDAVWDYDAKAAILGRIGAVLLEDFAIVLWKTSGDVSK